MKIILTVMSCCTFIMIVSSAVRMIIYIRYYYLTFLRIFVLWALAVLLVLFVGVVIGIYREKFPLFKYSVVVVTGFYLLLSYSHPDYIIAKVNVANAPHWEYCYEDFEDEWSEEADLTNEEFFLGGYYTDYRYLSNLSADAAPVLASYMEELGYDMEAYLSEDILSEKDWPGRNRISGFGYYYMDKMQRKLRDFSFRTYNISRHMAKISFNVPALMAYEKR